MFQDPRKINDFSQYAPHKKDLDAFYGLPKEIIFCKQCGISNQRPNSSIEHKHNAKTKKSTINIDSNGVCDACKTAYIKNNQIDWNERRNELMKLCDKHRSKNGSYDCIVPGSGGKDSFLQSWVLKYEFGMNPLTITWSPHLYTDWGYRNFRRWIDSGFDNYLISPNTKIQRLLSRLSLENLFHPFQPFILGQKYLAPKIAYEKGISLIFYGEDEAEYGNPIKDNDNALRDYEYFSNTNEDEIYLAGETLLSLRENFGIRKHDLELYIPPNPNKLKDKNIEVHYLGYYMKWHPQTAYYFAVEKGDFEACPERNAGTYSKYQSIDDKMDDFHWYTTFIKFGIGRATHDAAQEVRSGDIDIDEAESLIQRYDGEFPERFLDELLDYLSLSIKDFPIASKMFEVPLMDKEYFDALTNKFRSPHLWQYTNNNWSLRRQFINSE